MLMNHLMFFADQGGASRSDITQLEEFFSLYKLVEDAERLCLAERGNFPGDDSDREGAMRLMVGEKNLNLLHGIACGLSSELDSLRAKYECLCGTYMDMDLHRHRPLSEACKITKLRCTRKHMRSLKTSIMQYQYKARDCCR